METFLNEIIEWEKFELLIDTKIFDKDIILKSAYNFLDRWYFFFKIDNNWNIILQFTKRDDNLESPKQIISDFSDELLSVLLRDNLEKNNKLIREKIVSTALWNSIDSTWFVSIDTEKKDDYNDNQIDFDRDIEDILKEIENDPDLKIDEEEIEKILREIELETNEELNQEIKINLDIQEVKKQKKKFKK